MKVQRINDVQEARKRLRELDRRRANFAKVILGINWTDARNYHLSIDAGEVGFSESVALIKDVVAASAK
jgi:cytidylate kinase